MLISLFVVLVLGTGLALFSAWKSREIEATYPNLGKRYDIGGIQMNALHLPAGPQADLPPVVFIHGASGNLRDQVFAFRQALEGRGELLFVDRPGHGYSDRGGPENDRPDGQAHAIARLMDKLGIKSAIIVGHSFGGAIASSFAVLHPEKTAGLVLLAAATHPWPGGVDWYYHVAKLPVVGPLFCRIVVMPVGLGAIPVATKKVFSPNSPPLTYVRDTGPELVLRPAAFRANATDVAGLNDYVATMSARYREITTPTVIVSGDTDAIVAEEIHSKGLARDIPGSELLWVHGLGHKPDYIANDLVVAALEKISGQPRDLQAMARDLERQLEPFRAK
ncbi:alpha/beta hydrolase [Rhizobium sp. RU36D]|uniref:alpha/beta fold hydrolase n=1 Tax=Rhizobium sp. RU36D TaxID=1907415 RepID=UPI0009D7C15C|nr:alpha/beta hydrolase [Rhizobium sp. RU36D]SMC42157.1 Pimeloyl-ACP methyl ester carboxylesterase [Rhizobium sp. RU36D]